MAGKVTKATLAVECGAEKIRDAHMVKQILMSKSQLHPVMNAAAAGGKMIATYKA